MSAIEKHRAAVVSLGCALCRRLGYPHSPAQFHHPRIDQAAGKKCSDFLGIPLCMSHHTGQHGIHGDRADFKNAKVGELDLLADTIRLLFYERKHMIAVYAIVVATVIFTVGILWSGYVLHILWGWFMVPLFGLPTLSVAGAIAVYMVVGYLTARYDESYSKKDPKPFDTLVGRVSYMALKPALALLIGFVLKQFL